MNAISAVWKYGRFFIASIAGIVGTILVIMGVSWLPLLLVGLGVLALVLDLSLGTDEEIYHYDNPEIFYPLQYASQICGVVTAIIFAWLLGTPNDFLGIAAGVQALTGFDMIAAHANDTYGMYLSAFGLASITAALGSIAIGHELTHRVNNPTAVFLGRMGEAFGMHTRFSIRHPYGHHNWVCTPKDPATAKRGENFYPFAFNSIVGQNVQVWELEKHRLEKMGLGVWSVENKALRGWGMELMVAGMYFAAAGWLGVLCFLGVGLFVNVGLEVANYIEHYGLIRVDDTPQKVRHAWNDNHKLSYWGTVAISRHAHHHADADIEFWNLRPMPNDAPTTAFGYFLTGLSAFIPPLWHTVMNPKLLEWDEKFANEAERKLAVQANLDSGQELLIEAAEKQLEQLVA